MNNVDKSKIYRHYINRFLKEQPTALFPARRKSQERNHSQIVHTLRTLFPNPKNPK